MTGFFIFFHAKLCGNGLTPLLRAPLKRRKADSDHGRLQEINNAAASLRHPRRKNCPNGGGREGGRRRGRGGRLDDRMAAFTQRLFSPAETRSHVQHDRVAPRRAHAARSSSRRRGQRLTLASLGLFCFCVFDETSLRVPAMPPACEALLPE